MQLCIFPYSESTQSHNSEDKVVRSQRRKEMNICISFRYIYLNEKKRSKARLREKKVMYK